MNERLAEEFRKPWDSTGFPADTNKLVERVMTFWKDVPEVFVKELVTQRDKETKKGREMGTHSHIYLFQNPTSSAIERIRFIHLRKILKLTEIDLISILYLEKHETINRMRVSGWNPNYKQNLANLMRKATTFGYFKKTSEEVIGGIPIPIFGFDESKPIEIYYPE